MATSRADAIETARTLYNQRPLYDAPNDKYYTADNSPATGDYVDWVNTVWVVGKIVEKMCPKMSLGEFIQIAQTGRVSW